MSESFASPRLSPAISLPWAQEAYTEYLRSIHYISQVLLEEVEITKGTALSLTATPVLGKFWTPEPLVGPRSGGVLYRMGGHSVNMTYCAVVWEQKGAGAVKGRR